MKFSERLYRLGFATHSDYVQSDHWKSFRARYKAGGHRMTCLVCGTRPIQLHHRTYVRLGEELPGDVVPLCREHHVAVHAWLKSSGRIFVEYTHEAITALGGECPPAPREPGRRIKSKRPAKKLSQQKRKKLKKAARIAAATAILTGPPSANPEFAALVSEFRVLELSRRNLATFGRFAAKGNLAQLRGLLGSLLVAGKRRPVKPAPPAPVSPATAPSAPVPRSRRFVTIPRATTPFRFNDRPQPEQDCGRWAAFRRRNLS